MTDRWNPKRTTVVVEPPRNRIVVPGDVAGPSVEPRGKSWGIRVRGDTGGVVKHVYRCPVHGEFEVMVPRADVPDWQLCPARYEPREFAMFGLDAEGRDRMRALHVCAIVSPWAGSRCGIGHAAGEVMS